MRGGKQREQSKRNLTCLWTARVFGYAKGQNQHDSCSSALFDLHARQRERQLRRQQLQVLLKMSMWQILKYLYCIYMRPVRARINVSLSPSPDVHWNLIKK